MVPAGRKYWVDAVTVYDFATDGALASVETPVFASGYEYRFIVNVKSAKVGNDTLKVEAFKATAALYDPMAWKSSNTADGSAGEYFTGEVRISEPDVSQLFHSPAGFLSTTGGASNSAGTMGGTVIHSGADTVSKLRFSCSGGNLNGGTITQQRRKL